MKQITTATTSAMRKIVPYCVSKKPASANLNLWPTVAARTFSAFADGVADGSHRAVRVVAPEDPADQVQREEEAADANQLRFWAQQVATSHKWTKSHLTSAKCREMQNAHQDEDDVASEEAEREHRQEDAETRQRRQRIHEPAIGSNRIERSQAGGSCSACNITESIFRASRDCPAAAGNRRRQWRNQIFCRKTQQHVSPVLVKYSAPGQVTTATGCTLRAHLSPLSSASETSSPSCRGRPSSSNPLEIAIPGPVA